VRYNDISSQEQCCDPWAANRKGSLSQSPARTCIHSASSRGERAERHSHRIPRPLSLRRARSAISNRARSGQLVGARVSVLVLSRARGAQHVRPGRNAGVYRASYRARPPLPLRRRSADYLICHECGVCVGARLETRRGRFGILNTRALRPIPAEFAEPVLMDYSDEPAEARQRRREERWTPLATPTL